MANPSQEKKQEIEVVASFSGKINTGNYGQESPFFSAKTLLTGTQEEADKLQKELYKICLKNYRLAEASVHTNVKAKTIQGVRFYDTEFGGKYPSVTSVISAVNPKDFNMPEDRLRAYGCRGELAHYLFEFFVKEGSWFEPKFIKNPEVQRWLAVMEQYDIKLEGDFKGFFEKYEHEWISSEVKVFNHLDQYAGRQDAKGIYEKKVTLGDLKTGQIDKKECFKQLAAYAKCEGNEDVRQLAIYPINGKTKQGFSSIITTTEINKYYELFLKDRHEFKIKYGI